MRGEDLNLAHRTESMHERGSSVNQVKEGGGLLDP